MLKKLTNLGWNIYHKFRKSNFTGKFKNQEEIKKIPCGAIGHVFGSNKLTALFQELKTGEKDMPTHTIMYLGSGKHTIAEADVYFSKSRLERYAKSKVVFHYFKDMHVDELDEVKNRIYYLLGKKMVYDFMGYVGFVTREISFLRKIKLLSASNTTVFCSDGTVVVYHGDQDNNDDDIAEWTLMRNISVEYIANKNTPADIYLFLDQLVELMPEKVGRIILYPIE